MSNNRGEVHSDVVNKRMMLAQPPWLFVEEHEYMLWFHSKSFIAHLKFWWKKARLHLYTKKWNSDNVISGGIGRCCWCSEHKDSSLVPSQGRGWKLQL
jgi:hypothetical protein